VIEARLRWYCGVDARPPWKDEKIAVRSAEELERYIRAMRRSHPRWKLDSVQQREMPAAKVEENPHYERLNWKRKYQGVGFDFRGRG